ncbi:MAG: T9SS type A sorting domain-containing protein [Chitinophagaceae bacterium]|nr:MAG: T9SS type A sorting domain-containing protein [Chitinophagaceae bacterium]
MNIVSSRMKVVKHEKISLVKCRIQKIASSLVILALVMFSNPLFAQPQYKITEVVTDFNGYWKSGYGAINPVKPDNSHNLLSFLYKGTRYSTGVNDASLSAHGETFVPGDYRALPVSSLTGSITSNTKIGLGEKFDGVTNGKSNPSPLNSIPYYLTDGIKGLNIGTCIANLPASSMSFAISNIDLAAINDNIPDMVITQTADPSGVDFDRYEFTDINGNRIGNYVDIILSNIPSVGTWVADFYEASVNPMTLAAGFTKTERGLRLWTGDFGVFGINASNIANIAYFKITLSGNSDVAFVAYNNKAFNVDMFLPTTLTTFSGKLVSDGIQLNWETVSESNSDKFVIEKSIDGSAFSAIGTIPAAGQSNTRRQYNFMDPVSNSRSYYRIRMVDADGKWKYSTVITVNTPASQNIKVSAYPNPSASYTYIVHPQVSGNTTLRIYNAQGIVLSQVKMTGTKTLLDLTQMAKGNYHVAFEGPDGNATVTVQKQ